MALLVNMPSLICNSNAFFFFFLLILVRDIIDENGIFYDEHNLSELYFIKTNFLSVLQLRQAIPIHWRTQL